MPRNQKDFPFQVQLEGLHFQVRIVSLWEQILKTSYYQLLRTSHLKNNYTGELYHKEKITKHKKIKKCQSQK